MSNSVTTSSNGVVVITHVYPAGTTNGVTSPPYCMGPRLSSALEKFPKRRPTALGTVQIVAGLVILLLGIVMAMDADSIGVFSGTFVWGSIVYVIAGSLTVAADNHLNKCLVNGSLGMNVVAAVVAMPAIVIHSLDTAGLTYSCYNFSNSSNYNCQVYLVRSRGISGILVVLSLLEFILSICVSIIACNAVCKCCQSEPEQGIIIGNHIPVPDGVSLSPSNAPLPPLNNYETMMYPKEPERGRMDTGFPQHNPPPHYTAVLP
ncbi:hypothetical protein DPEC_G00275070 [Dallia pectoralis]|uniref:Uncharacterized protein n=1 Tax=Dallia pectoralis TaxID=75939 RepID=A0ACC2FLB4_DALPE|nr:hypothetical protein DPEC_G00275070 [Dallia pectoralis]